MKRVSAKAWKQLEAVYKGGPAKSGDYCCSDYVFKDGRAAASADAPSDADAGPTATLRCPHGGLLREQVVVGPRRQRVPQIVWEYLVHIAERVVNSKRLGYKPSQGIKLLALNAN